MSDRISANIRRDTATSAIWKRDVAAMADDLRADLDQLLPQAGQRPRLRCFGHRHSTAHLKARGSPWKGLGCSKSARCGNGRFRRVSSIAACSGEGRLTEPTAVAQPWPPEPVFVPVGVDKRAR